MKRQPAPPSRIRAASPILLVLGMMSFIAGWVTNQDIFTWMAVIFLTISLVTSGRWFGKRQ